MSVLIFLVLLLAAFLLVRPLFRTLKEATVSVEQKILGLVEEKTGLGISYRSLSPSILSNLRMNGVTVYDKTSGDPLLKIRNVTFSYNLDRLLAGDLNTAFSKLVLNDIDIEFDREKYSAIIEKISGLFGGEKEKEEDEGSVIEKIWNVLFKIPFAVQLKNVRIHYRDKNLDAAAKVRVVNMNKQEKGEAVDIGMEGDVGVGIAALGGKTVGAKFNINGKILPEISGTSLTVLLDKNGSDYSINKSEFLLRYSDRVFALRTTKQIMPFSLGAEYNIDTQDIRAQISTENLDPFSVVKMPALTGTLAKLRGMRVSTDASLGFNVGSKAYNWNAKGSVGLPAGLLWSYERAVFDLAGNNSVIRAHSLGVYGDMVGASFNGSMSMKTFMPSGELRVDHFKLPTGGIVRGDAYLDPFDGGITCFIPQLYLGEQDFTALQIDLFPSKSSVGFSFSVSDYSHMEAEQPGILELDGAFNFGRKNSVVTGINIDRIYLDTVVKAISFFMGEESGASILGMAPKFSPYIMSGEFFVSTDFSSLTFNCPYVVLANTEKDRQMLFLSMDGSNETVNITQFELLFGKISAFATAGVDLLLKQKQIMFTTDLSLNNIPYSLAGAYTFGEWLTVSGDYGLELDVNFNDPLHGIFKINEFPLSMYGFLLSLSASSDFTYSSDEGLLFNLDNLTVEDLSNHLNLGAKIILSGALNNSGVVFDQIGYSDSVSSLAGDGSLYWSIDEDGIFNSADLDISLSESLGEEKIFISGTLENPELLGTDSILQAWPFELDVSIDSFQMRRFMANQNQDNTLSGNIHGYGTLENPFVSLDLSSLSLNLGNRPLNVNGNAVYQNGMVSLSKTKAEWLPLHFGNINGELNLEDFSGELKADIVCDVGSSKVDIPLELTFESDKELLDAEGGNYYSELFKIPEEITLYLDADPVHGDILKRDIPLHFILQKSPGLLIVTSDEYFGLSGYVYDTGEMMFTVDENKPLHFNFDGTIDGSNMDFHVRNFYLDLANFAFMVNSDKLSLYAGTLSGDLDLSGLFTDPIFHGELLLDGLDLNLPNYIPEHITAKHVKFEFEENEITVPVTNFIIQSNNVAVDALIKLDRWVPNDILINMSTGANGRIPFDVDIPFVRVKGEASADLHLAYNSDGLDLRGDVFLQKTDATVIDSISDLTKKSGSDKDKEKEKKEKKKKNENSDSGTKMPVSVDLNLTVGPKVNFIVNPILRGMLAPDSSLHLTMDTMNSLWSLKGDVALRGGEVFYLNRNFYLKEGRIYLNESQASFDPELTLRAETRERDSEGRNVTIALEAVHQKASQFSPALTANPVKSETEIMALLGQIATGDATSATDILISTGELVAQTVFTRKLENALRDLLNFDILSLRTAVLQNVINQTIASSGDKEFPGIGNFFDNTTVYIGKYFGSDIYVDALMQWSYDDDAAMQSFNSGGGLVFKPEIGFEMLSPFGNIRWQFAPDFGALSNSVVSSTSITLSWRMQF